VHLRRLRIMTVVNDKMGMEFWGILPKDNYVHFSVIGHLFGAFQAGVRLTPGIPGVDSIYSVM
jgi:hypothetical protein